MPGRPAGDPHPHRTAPRRARPAGQPAPRPAPEPARTPDLLPPRSREPPSPAGLADAAPQWRSPPAQAHPHRSGAARLRGLTAPQ
ncbi:hypothetical protein [Streptomyces maremycinicus]|uniref:hypothetical protein n=1 Tax=Streptomyces maremycinicus TaxID=1679753 RepID=UPI0013315F60|nr:hypothetical protein [Streptomyces sp. NBRC 110468]